MFAALYDNPTVNEKGIVEQALKASCCCADTACHYVAGSHFTAEMLYTFADGKIFIGRSLWGFGEEVMNSVKKAISLMPKLSPQICSIDKNFAVIKFSSGKMEDNLFPMIDNGMYDMEVREGGAAVVNAYAHSTKADDPKDNTYDNESRKDSVTDMEEVIGSDWEPFKGVEAPFGYSYEGKLAFLCMGPTMQHFSKSFVWEDQNMMTPKQRRRVHMLP